MSLRNTVSIALVALRTHMTRSFLTVLGIIIGIASVIVMVSVSSGSRAEIELAIDQLGSNMLTVRAGARTRGRRGGSGSADPLTEKHVGRLKEAFPFIEGISGNIDWTVPVVRGSHNWITTVAGIHADFLDVRRWVIEEGRGFTEREVKSGGKVAILGQEVVEQLFDGASPLGARIRIKNVPFTVVGTVQAKGESWSARSHDDIVFVPISTARMRLSGRNKRGVPDEVGKIYLTVNREYDIRYAEEDIRQLMRELRKIAPGAQDDFSVDNMAEFIRARNESSATLGLLLGATAVIALIVGGIGIMNIMLVSVTERTREIGLRIAVGASRGDILKQFLVEAVILCLIGGLFGVAIGIGAGELIRQLSDIPVQLNVPIVFVAIASAALVGIFFGFYPANRASRLNPIDALRYE